MRVAVGVLLLGILLAGGPARAQKWDPATTYRVPVGSAPVRGPATARVTVVEFIDFQCPFCVRAQSVLESLLRRYPDDVRLVVRHRPLSMHPHAAGAARAAAAAALQGKFWPYHDLLWSLGTDQLGEAAFEAVALRAGLDMARWRRDVAGAAVKKVVAADEAAADALGVTGTPIFFVNGRPLVGAQPIEVFDAAVAEARTRADAVLAKGVARDRLYDALIKDGKAGAPAGGAAPAPSIATEARPVPVAGAPSRGRADAPVTIVEFSDFQCPFCVRGQAVIAQVLARYGERVRLVYRHFPLDFHADAFGAAEAAVFAAGEGKFWELHDALFAHPRELGRDEVEGHAATLGLDLVRLRLALDSGRFETRVAEDMELGTRLGVTGTPAFFVNGRLISGAHPVEVFAKVIDEELAKAAALRARGIPAARVYETLVGLAKEGAPAVGGARGKPAAATAAAAVPAAAAEVEHALAALSACYRGQTAHAKAALTQLTAARRASVIKDCKALGVALD